MKIIIFTFIFFMSTALANILEKQEDLMGKYENVYQLSFKSGGTTHPHCTATVLDEFTILTAAHCTDNIRGKKSLKVLISGRSLKVDRLIIPREYFALSSAFYATEKKVNSNPSDESLQSLLREKHKAVALYDIVLVKLKKPLEKSIAKTKLSFSKPKEGSKVTSVGFGYLSKKQTSEGVIYNNPKFAQIRSETLTSVDSYLEIIAGDDNKQITSAGDSGGPLFNEDNEQVGVLRGISTHPNHISSIFSAINFHAEFIKSHTK